jgi:hypothetical protein
LGCRWHVSDFLFPAIALLQGLLAPVVLSVSLFGLYLLIKFTDFDLQVGPAPASAASRLRAGSPFCIIGRPLAWNVIATETVGSVPAQQAPMIA